MKPTVGCPAPTPALSPQISRALTAMPLLFWPVFMLLTILEEKAGMVWLQTQNATLWRPIAIAAFVLAGVVPLFLGRSVRWKIVASICALLGFAATYGLVVLIGVSFLNWGD